MWIRRLGVRPYWPSRIKVVIRGVFASGFMYAIYRYMGSANAGYLNLFSPVHETANCFETSDWCRNSTDAVWCSQYPYMPASQDLDDILHIIVNAGGAASQNQSARSHCPIAVASCRSGVPQEVFNSGILYREKGRINWFRVGSTVFLFLTLTLVVSVTLHDLTLIIPDNRKTVWNWRAAEVVLPKTSKFIWGVLLWDSTCTQRKTHLALWVLLLPLWIAWMLCMYMLIVWPLVLCISFFSCKFRYTVGMARILVFCTALQCAILGVGITIRQLTVSFFNAPEYALMWSLEENRCVCSCSFPVSRSTTSSIVSIGVATAFQGITLCMRTFKGLRRREWGCLLTVLYPVPVAVFPVHWTQPDGQPIQFRSDGEPVQGEPAFDPFALMDEQPMSHQLTVKLEPTPMIGTQSRIWDTCDHDGLRALREQGPTEIGCCGFPLYEKPQGGNSCCNDKCNDLCGDADSPPQTDEDDPYTEDDDSGG